MRHFVIENAYDLGVILLRFAEKHIFGGRDVLQAWHVTNLPFSLSMNNDFRLSFPNVEAILQRAFLSLTDQLSQIIVKVDSRSQRYFEILRRCTTCKRCAIATIMNILWEIQRDTLLRGNKPIKVVDEFRRGAVMEQSKPALRTLLVHILLALEFIFADIIYFTLEACLYPLCSINASIHSTECYQSLI